MKKSNLAFTLAVVIAALAAPFGARANIASIESVADSSTSVAAYPNMNSPLVAGQTLYVRLRMLNKGWLPNISDGTGWKWDSEAFTESTGPALGLAVGGKRVWAPYATTTPGLVANGAVNGPVTDLYFAYKVQPGDIGKTVCLLRTDYKTSDSSNGDFLIRGVNDGTSKFTLVSDDSDATAAEFKYVDQATQSILSTFITVITSTREIKERVYVQAVDFDSPKYTDAWRYVDQGAYEPVDGLVPTINCSGAGENEALYVWSDDESVCVPIDIDLNPARTNVVDGKTVLTIPLSGSAETVRFYLKGGDAAVGSTTKIYMSPAVLGSYTEVGTSIEESAVATTVKLVNNPPTVSLYFNETGNDPLTVDCQTNYAKAAACTLTARLSKAVDHDVTVNLAADLAGSDLAALFNDDIIGLGSTYLKEDTSITIPAGHLFANLNLYALGWNDDTVESGINFTIAGIENDTGDVTVSDDSINLVISRLNPAITTERPTLDVYNKTEVPDEKFQVTVEDCYLAEKDWGAFTFDIIPDVNNPDNKLTGVPAVHKGGGVFSLKPTFVMTPGVTYDAQVIVRSPTGTSGSTTFSLIVKKAKTVYATASASSADEGGKITVSFSLSESYNANTWAFLVPTSENAEEFVNANGAPFTSGVLIEAGETDGSYTVDVEFADGENKPVTFEAVLSSEENTLTRVTAYSPSNLKPTVSVQNVAPKLTNATFNNKRVTGATVATVPRKATISMGLVAFDVDGDLDAVNTDTSLDGVYSDANRQFMAIWRFDDGSPDLVTYGNPAGQTVSREFTSDTEVSIYLKDKDQKLQTVLAGEPVKTFTVPVGDEPGVKIAFLSEYDTGVWNEDGEDDHSVLVSLNPAPAEDVTVQLTVPKGSNGGFLKFITDADVSLVSEDDAAIVYNVAISANQSSPVRLDIDAMDGTSTTRALYITGVVTTDTPSGYGDKTWADYYKAGKSPKIQIKNIAPTIARPTEEQAAITNTTVKVYSPFSVDYQIGEEVRADLDRGVKAELIVDGDTIATEDVTDTRKHTFANKVEFTSGGLHTVTVVFTDKDGNSGEDGDSSEPRTMLYDVLSTKNVMVAAHGPGASRVSANGHSVRYAKAKGLGAGRVDGEQNPQSIKSWVSTYAVSASESGLNMTARGYQTADPLNDTIDAFGNTRGTADSFSYTNNVGVGMMGYDSFFYAWTCNNSKPSDGIELASDLLIAPGLAGEYEIPLQPYDKEKTTYDNQYWEAIFSREWRKTDNLGDINADGVPDIFVALYDFGVINRTTSTVLDGDDIAPLNDYNEDGDFYGASTNAEQKFVAQMEIRGLHDGLNYGMFPVTDTEGWISELELSPAEKAALDRCLAAKIEDGSWTGTNAFDLATAQGQADAKAFITWTWREYVEGDASTWGFTVENRTDPTKEDTDGDGMPDGYEYYWWYAATIGSKDDGTGLATGKAFNLADLDNPTDISPADIARIYNPNASIDWTKQDTDNDGLTDYEERAIGTNPVNWDSDGDGLSDLYEVMWSIDPLKNQNGVNGAMNNDHDFMAFADVGSYTIYKLGNGSCYAFKLPPTVESGEGGTNTVRGAYLAVLPYNGKYIPATEMVTERLLDGSYGEFTYVDGDATTVTYGSVALYHYQVYNRFGFDPRTGWWKDPANGTVSRTTRWLDGGSPLQAGTPVNTMPFTARDEFMLLKYRYLLGLRNLADDQRKLAAEETTMAAILAGGCTNPNAVKDSWSWPFGDKAVSYPTTHGADTDVDGVPDGWELYVGVNPNVPFTSNNEGLYNVIRDTDREDGLALLAEYAGTDTCGNYDEGGANCSSIYANHPSEASGCMPGWFNKFMPTDPRDDDTDGDGIKDGQEGKSWSGIYTMNRWGQRVSEVAARTVKHFSIYGSPTNAVSRCIQGGGYNPCTIDTDGDILPDPWERQYAGLLFHGNNISTEGDYKVFGVAGPPSSEFFDDIRAAVTANFTTNTSGWRVLMGMDGTKADATANTVIGDPDMDWDGDGLQNWQEYMVQAMRHLRYDDSRTPLMGMDMPAVDYDAGTIVPGQWNGPGEYLRISYTEPLVGSQIDKVAELGYKNFAKYVESNPDYLRTLGYFAEPPKEWDIQRIDRGELYMLPPTVEQDRVATMEYQHQKFDVDLDGLHLVWDEDGSEWVDPVPVVDLDTILSDEDALIDIITNTYAYGTGSVSNNVTSTGTTWYYLEVDDEDGEEYAYYVTPKYETTSHTVKSVRKTKAIGYVGTDPRLWDTDFDGMDDFYELYHGLNPLLGSIGSLATVTNAELGTSYTTIVGAHDVIGSTVPNVSAWRNAWTGWENTDTPPYDPIRFPWMMGVGDCDADGDGLRNYEEMLLSDITQPGATHTDPTPLWMTDNTHDIRYEPVVTAISITNYLYTADGKPVYVKVNGERQRKIRDVTESVITNSMITLVKGPSYTQLYYPCEVWPLIWLNAGYNYMASFEVNEGYDSDNDMRGDRLEQIKTAEPSSDPLHFGDPSRRQSLWLGGQDDPGLAITVMPAERETNGNDLFKQFTVEAWAKPETLAAGHDQCIVSRSVLYGGWDIENANTVVRCNFALGIDADGCIYAGFDDSTDGSVRATGSKLDDGEWTHLAATYDGERITLYVNGIPVKRDATAKIPANGLISLIQDPQYDGGFPYINYRTEPGAVAVGGRATGPAAFAYNLTAKAASWNEVADDFFGGWVDEVRVWDGARTDAQILAEYKTRFDADKAKELRDGIYQEYRERRTRAGTAGAEQMSAELVMHYDFTTLGGAPEADNAQRIPGGFEAQVLDKVVNPSTGSAIDQSAIEVGWWSKVQNNEAVASKVYTSKHYVPWIENTVAHLPPLSGRVMDSVYWNENYAGYTPASFHGIDSYTFPNSMTPYNWTVQHGEADYLWKKLRKIESATNETERAHGAITEDSPYRRLRFDVRHEFNEVTDLVPLGSAFPKRISEDDGGSWDGEGAEDAWSITTREGLDGDKNGDGIPDWYDGSTEDYIRDLAAGLLPDGSKPNDEWADTADLDNDGLPDWWEKLYDVYADGADDDTDRDGLSNYQEYLIREVYGLEKVDPGLAYSTAGQKVTDYYLRYGTLYYGELFADHDHIEDWFEDEQPVEAVIGGKRLANYSRFTYDAARDVDGSGWNNWLLARAYIEGMYTSNIVTVVTNSSGRVVATTNEVTGSTLADRKGNLDPAVDIHVFYNGKMGNLGYGSTVHTIAVKVWGLDADGKADLSRSPDKVWGMKAESQNALDMEGLAHGYSATLGSVRPGRSLFVAYAVEGEYDDGTEIPPYEEGMPYGVAYATIGAKSGEVVDIELTDFNPAMMRVNLPEAIALQRVYADSLAAKDSEWWGKAMTAGSAEWRAYYSDMNAAYESMVGTADRGKGSCSWATIQRAVDYCGTNLVFASSNIVHVWVAQLLLNGEKNSNGLYYKPLFTMGAVDLSKHNVLTEADLVNYGYPDLGWGTVGSAYLEDHPNISSLTSATFGLILERSPVTYPNANNLLLVEMVNHYEKGLRQTAIADRQVRNYSGQPTFSWTHANTIGKDYPAFQLKVWKSGTVVYDSGVQPAPVRDASGRYNWTAPIWVGSMLASGTVFEGNEEYVWDASMLDAKFTSFGGSAGAGQKFTMQESSPSGGATDYGVIPVKVKYTGPGTVSTTAAKQCLRVEAYLSSDFSGTPVGVGFVTDAGDLKDVKKISVNAQVTGLPTSNEYYLLAYIDTNGNGVHDDWESWGYACYYMDPDRDDIYTPRAYKPGNAAAVENCLIYVNDADTNGNMVPDVWEWEKDGRLGGATATGAASLSPYYSYTLDDATKKSALSKLGSKFGAPALMSSLAYATMLSAMRSGEQLTAEQAFIITGIDVTKVEASPKVSISSFSLADGITLAVDPSATVDGEEVSSTAPLTIKVYVTLSVQYTDNLASATWTEAARKTMQLTLASGERKIGADELTDVNDALREAVAEHGSGCYFRVVVEVGEK